MPGTLDTTNTWLFVIAMVSLLQGLVIIGLGFAGWKIYRLATTTMREIDEKRIKPIAAKVDSVVERVHQITDRVHQRAERVEAAIDETVGRVNHATTGVKSSVSDTVHKVSDAVTGLRAALVNALTTEESGGNGRSRHSRLAHDPTAVPGPARVVPMGERGQLDDDGTRNVREGGF
jgi:phage-related protein